MNFVSLYNGEKLPKIGLGTWKMGGDFRPDNSKDKYALEALKVALDIGYTHIDTAEMYASGHTEELVGKVLKNRDRSKIFITTKVHPRNLRFNDVIKSVNGSLNRLGLDSIDLYLIHWPKPNIPLEETFKALNQCVRDGKVRHLGVSNFDLPILKKAEELSETPIITNQVPYSLYTREYINNGVISYCQKKNIMITSYSPFEEGKLKVKTILEKIAQKYNVTPHQIALAWLVQQPNVIAIPMSQNHQHLSDNLDAGNIQLSEDEMAQLFDL